MGLGRLNPGCDDCHVCVDCELFLDGCSVVWDCPIDGMYIVGNNPFIAGPEFFRSEDHSGVYDYPPWGATFTIYRDIGGVRNQVVSLLIPSLPSQCCSEVDVVNVSSHCKTRYPDLDGMAINIIGIPGWLSSLNGIYVLSPANRFIDPYYFVSYRMFSEFNSTVLNYTFCSGLATTVTPIINYNYAFECPSLPLIPPSTVFTWIGWYVEIENAGLYYRCAQSIRTGIRVVRNVLNRSPIGFERFNWCQDVLQFPVKYNESIGCNDPSVPLTIDVTGDESFDTYTENYFSSCSANGIWNRNCCPVGPF